MGTRGLYGFRFNGVEKLTYNHYDSYPDCLGAEIANFCERTPVDEMKDIFSRIIMVDENSTPTAEQITACEKYMNLSVGRQSSLDWYCLLRELQGELNKLKEIHGDIYMIDNHNFIKDSLFCEYAYIIDLNEEVLEFYIGFQRKPDPENRYGQECDDGYYPCRQYATYKLGIDAQTVVDAMNMIAENPEKFENRSEDDEEDIVNAAESAGWTAKFWDNGMKCVCFSNCSPIGEDLELEFEYINIEDLADRLREEWENFGPEEHVYDLIKYSSNYDALPRSITDLLVDAEDIDDMYRDLYNAIREIV